MNTKFIYLVSSIFVITCHYILSSTPSNNEVNTEAGTSISGFIENRGQLCDVNYNPAPYLLFKLQGKGIDVFITEWGLSYVFEHMEEKPQNSAAGNTENIELPNNRFKPKDIMIKYCRADMELVNAKIRKNNIIKESESTDFYNYYLSQCPYGIKEVRSYGRITIKDVYPGIDWILYNTSSGGLKYDFVIHPYADPSQIKLRYKWTDKPEKHNDEVTLTTPFGKITEGKPYGCNSVNSVNVTYNIEDGNINFRVEAYNTSEKLIIDPQLIWATYYGGNTTDVSYSINSDGISVWVTGYSTSTNFPIQNLSGAYNQGTLNGNYNAFILNFNTTGARQWATYYGGTGTDTGMCIISDGTNVWITGTTYSIDFPIQFLSGAYNQASRTGNNDGFILKFNTSGVRQWATYYGGNGSDDGNSIYSDGNNLWVTGTTYSSNLPIQNLSGAYNQETLYGNYNAFILNFNTIGVRKWATYYGGNNGDEGNSIHSDGNNVWVTGSTMSADFPLQYLVGSYNQVTLAGQQNAFILKFNTSGVRQWATYYGGNRSNSGYSIQCDGTSVWLTGSVNSDNFPIQNFPGAYNQDTPGGISDGFILKFNTSGVRQWATYYGGSNFDWGNSIYSDGSSLWVTGNTGSTNFPVQFLSGAYNQGTYGGGGPYHGDAFILKFNTSGVRQWATYYGGNGGDDGNSIHSDGTNMWVTGNTQSTNFPIQNLQGAYNQGILAGSENAYILKFTSVIGVKILSNNIPSLFKLYNNYPNPFNPKTIFKFDIPKESYTKIIIYDLPGREVETLINNKLQPGTYETEWDGTNFASGIYFYKIEAGDFVNVKKMVLLK